MRKRPNFTMRLTVLCLVFTVPLWGLSWEQFTLRLPEMGFWLLVLQPVVLLHFLLESGKYQWLMNSPQLSFPKALECYLLSLGFNLLLPARLGLIVRSTYLKSVCGIRVAHSGSALLVENLANAACLVILTIATLTYRQQEFANWPVFIVLVPCLAFPHVFCRPATLLLSKLDSWGWKEPLIETIERIGSTTSSRKYLFLILASMGTWSLFLFYSSLFFWGATGQAISFHHSMLIFIATAVGRAVPIFPGGLGTGEAASAYLLVYFGCALELAIAVAVAYRLLTFIIPCATTCILVTQFKGDIKSLFFPELSPNE